MDEIKVEKKVKTDKEVLEKLIQKMIILEEKATPNVKELINMKIEISKEIRSLIELHNIIQK
ncbi:TPA: hypothetical protein KRM61_001043 [Clostridioides difficile]|uniref:hypothetical protein n=1 Tax=Clostridioides sp. ES-S-0001-02 TaxID=2770770 RepID=UPI000BB1AEBF|nr:hypothetical protein [Clostridioides sp. ES-S-0001-02]MDI3042771.1 hypothetical protein [Clostridioides difficile]MDI6118394.1 hypothetical protein [Clostridioides difficile]MDI6219301.1 hypothetical protein [Clostridioides difficile]MDN9157810.1 hypothetical protein [Clostridioides difficile]